MPKISLQTHPSLPFLFLNPILAQFQPKSSKQKPKLSQIPELYTSQIINFCTPKLPDSTLLSPEHQLPIFIPNPHKHFLDFSTLTP